MSENARPLLSVQSVEKHYGGTPALRGVSFDVQPGEIFGLIGPNGAGKTTALEIVLGLRRADAGNVYFDGTLLAPDQHALRANIGAHLQGATLQPKLTPRAALRLFGAFYARAQSVEETLARFGMLDAADRSFDALSGGQRQRLFLALAFLNDPLLAVLDEPTSALDPQARRELQTLIAAQRNSARAVLFSTHDLREAETLCDRVAILHEGRIIALDTPRALIARASRAPRIHIAATALPPADRLLALPGVIDVQLHVGSAVIASRHLNATIAALTSLLRDGELVDLHLERPSLEDVYFELTGADAGKRETEAAAP